jgi:lipopolysaccharide transport system ATP-binding protein
MSEPAIQVRGVWKRFRKGASLSLRDAVSELLGHLNPFRRNGHAGIEGGLRDERDFWALRDVSFDVAHGEALGIIGPNGAGKTTMLQLLCGILRPDRGTLSVRGRIGALIALGAGFQGDLTGRENIYLNGSIMGLTRKEIRAKFDQIVEFAGVQEFLDTPVKRYSSGMYVRLGFAVAAHLEPDVLIVDEVLAVGDAQFRGKCSEKMKGVADRGRAVVIVTHDMGAVTALCDRCLLLSQGRLISEGRPEEVVRAYLARNSGSGSVDLRGPMVDRRYDGPMRVTFLASEDASGSVRSHFAYGEPITFRIGVRGRRGGTCTAALAIRDPLGNLVLHLAGEDERFQAVLEEEEAQILARLDNNVLNQGRYYVSVWLGQPPSLPHDCVDNCLELSIDTAALGGASCKASVRLPVVWSVQKGPGRCES